MPAAIPAIIGALVSTGVGFGLNKLTSSSGPSQTDINQQMQEQAKTDAEKQAKSEAMIRQQMLRKSAPDAQAAVGGSLTATPFAQLTADIAGEPGSLQDALRMLGQSGGGDSSTTGLAFSGGF